MAKTPLEEVFRSILGLPCWMVANVYGSFFSMRFGRPRLVVSAPQLRPVFIETAPKRLQQREARVESDWYLMIHLCEWSLCVGEAQLASGDSAAAIRNRALHVLEGQGLTSVRVESDGSTHFNFDLGCVLYCRPAPTGAYGDEPSELWWVSDHDSSLTVRDDGRYSLGPSNEESRDWPLLEPMSVTHVVSSDSDQNDRHLQ